MPPLEPLPFRIPVPGDDRVGLGGVQSISWKIEGLLHHEGDRLVFEWGGTRSVQKVSLGETVDRVEPLEPGVLEVPIEWIAGARLKGLFGRAALVLRARRLEAFDGLPAAAGGDVKLRFRRGDLGIARAMVREINQ